MKTKPIPETHQKKLDLLGRYLKNLRINENMTLVEVGEQTNLHHNTIQRAEAGANSTLLTYLEIADFYQVLLSDLMSILD